MLEWFYDVPWWVPAGLALGGVALAFSGNRRQERQMLLAGGAAVALAAVLAGVSHLVDTPTESAVARTRALVAGVAARDWPAVRGLLDAETTSFGFRGPDEIADAAAAGVERVGLSSASVTGLAVDRVDTNITVDVAVFSQQSATMDRPAKSTWRLTYQNLGDDWRLYEIEALPDGGVTPEQVERRLR